MHNNDALDYQTIVIKMNDGSLSVHVYRRTQSGSYATDFIGESRMRGPPRPPLTTTIWNVSNNLRAGRRRVEHPSLQMQRSKNALSLSY